MRFCMVVTAHNLGPDRSSLRPSGEKFVSLSNSSLDCTGHGITPRPSYGTVSSMSIATCSWNSCRTNEAEQPRHCNGTMFLLDLDPDDPMEDTMVFPFCQNSLRMLS